MENYDVVGQIGKGNFGLIYRIKRKTDGKILVWKEIDYGNMNEKEKQQIVSEVNILRELRHPNIVKYYDRIIDKKNSKIYIVMEYCEAGDMGAVIKKCRKSKVRFNLNLGKSGRRYYMEDFLTTSSSFT